MEIFDQGSMLQNRASFVSSFKKNHGHLERFSCHVSSKKIGQYYCKVKYIDRENIKVLVWANLTEPLTAAHVHILAYYRYNTWFKIADFWIDLCGWISGKEKAYVLDYLKPLIFKYTNLNHSCPYSGYLFGKVDNISLQLFTFPQIVPSGRYRIEVNVTEGDRNKPFASATIQSSISDHRIEVV